MLTKSYEENRKEGSKSDRKKTELKDFKCVACPVQRSLHPRILIGPANQEAAPVRHRVEINCLPTIISVVTPWPAGLDQLFPRLHMGFELEPVPALLAKTGHEAVIVILAKSSDIFGRKTVTIGSIAAFTVFSGVRSVTDDESAVSAPVLP